MNSVGTIRVNTVGYMPAHRLYGRGNLQIYPFEKLEKIGQFFMISSNRAKAMPNSRINVLTSARGFKKYNKTFKVSTSTQKDGSIKVTRVK